MSIIYETKQSGIHAWHRTKVRQMHLHLHDYAEILYVRSGTMHYSVNFTEYEMHAGDVIFAFPGQIHGHRASDAENIALIFPSDLPSYDAVFCNLRPETPILHGVVDAELDALFVQAAKANRSSELPYYKGIALGYIALIVGRLLPHLDLRPNEGGASSVEQRLIEGGASSVEQRLIEYCSLHYREPITLSSVAEALGYSATHLSHLFADKFKTGFSKLISAMRVEDAKKMLRGNTMITQIALDCGFGSMRNFNRVFKEITGMTPSEYRSEKTK